MWPPQGSGDDLLTAPIGVYVCVSNSVKDGIGINYGIWQVY